MKHETETAEYQRRVAAFVGSHVQVCVSHLISHFAQTPEALGNGEYCIDDLYQICTNYQCTECDGSGCDYCDEGQLDYPAEALEHWVVSGWLAEKLSEKGEMTTDDFMGLTIWGRTTSGQSISLDSVICDIYNELNG